MRAVLVGLVVSVIGCGTEPTVDDFFTRSEWDFIQTFRLDQQPAAGCPGGLEVCDDLARFGQVMFFDPRFSGEITVAADGFNGGVGQIKDRGKVACVDCHDPRSWFADGRSRPNASSLGTAWTKRNTPGLVDVVYQKSFTWSGKYTALADVLELAVTSGAALNTTKAAFAQTLAENHRQRYDQIFSAPLPAMIAASDVPRIFQNAALAIAAYESKLIAGPSLFDRYAAGEDVPAFGDAEKRGLSLFIGKALCSECHTGPMFSDFAFHNTGVEQRGDHAPPADHGRAGETGEFADDGRFRTPTLRHIAKTAPYMHAGQLANLSEVIELYRWGTSASGFSGTKDPRMVALEIDDDDVRDLEAFLRTLTGAPVEPSLLVEP